MNFEELKSEWDKEPEKEVKIPESMEKFRKSNLPIEQVKIMMRKELLIQSLSIIFIGILPIISTPFEIIHDLKVYYLGYLVLLIISGLFIVKFYGFYNNLNNMTTKTKESIYEIYYEIRLNLEAYKTWSYLITPFLIIMLCQIFFNKKIAEKFNLSPNITDNLTIFFIIILISSIYVYYATNWWINKNYQPHLNRIKSILFGLNDDEEIYETNLNFEKENKIGFWGIKIKNKKYDWWILAGIIIILFSIGYAFGTWLAKSGF